MAKNVEITYSRRGDYLLPNLMIGEEPLTYGKYGMLRKNYLKENRKNWYRSMDLSGKLADHLLQTDRRANERIQEIMGQLVKKEGITEKLKAADQMEWIRRMNSIKARAEEMVLTELIYN